MLLIAALTALALTAAACGGSDDDDSGDGANGDDATASASVDGGDDGDEATATPDETEDATSVFRGLAEEYGQIAAKVTYESTSGGTTTTMTIYSKSPNSRIDTVDGDGNVTTIITTRDTSYLCSANQCIETEATGSFAGLLTGLFDANAIVDAAANVAGLDTFDEEIAGEDASCFSTSGSFLAGQGAGEATWCFASDGLLLRGSFSAAGAESSIEATEVSRDVTDADFEPPFDVIDVGA